MVFREKPKGSMEKWYIYLHSVDVYVNLGKCNVPYLDPYAKMTQYPIKTRTSKQQKFESAP